MVAVTTTAGVVVVNKIEYQKFHSKRYEVTSQERIVNATYADIQSADYGCNKIRIKTASKLCNLNAQLL